MESFEDFDLLLTGKPYSEDVDELASFSFNTPLFGPTDVKEDSLSGINLPSMTGAGFSPSFASSAFSRLPVPTVLDIGSRKGSLNSSTKSNVSLSVKREMPEKQQKKQVKRKKINYTGMSSEEIALAKRTRRREQIAKASRLSRARRKQELTDLREENKKLKAERESHLRTIKELSRNVQDMRKAGSIDVVKENQMLRAQLEQHKTFLTCFKHLCDDNQYPKTSSHATESLMEQGSNAAHEHVLSLLSQSVADDWQEVYVEDDLDLPYEDFSASFKLVTEFGYENSNHDSAKGFKQRLNVRIDIGYEGMDSGAVVDFLWSSLSNSSAQKRLYNVENLQVVQLESDTESAEQNTKLYYYKEENEPPLKHNDWVVICNNRNRKIPSSLLMKPSPWRKRVPITDVESTILSLSTTQHGSAPEVPNANRIKSFFLQGAAIYSEKANARIVVVFSFPDDFSTSLIAGFDDIILADGRIGNKFAGIIKELHFMMNEQDSS